MDADFYRPRAIHDDPGALAFLCGAGPGEKCALCADAVLCSHCIDVGAVVCDRLHAGFRLRGRRTGSLDR